MLREPARERKCAATELSLENCRLPVDLSFRGLSNRILASIRDISTIKIKTCAYPMIAAPEAIVVLLTNYMGIISMVWGKKTSISQNFVKMSQNHK